MFTFKLSKSSAKRSLRIPLLRNMGSAGIISLFFMAFVLMACGDKEQKSGVSSKFKSMTTEQKMEYLSKRMSPDKVAKIVCESAIGESKYGPIDLQEARMYVYTNYTEDNMIAFEQECLNFEKTLSLKDQMKFAQQSGIDDMSEVAYGMGLGYVSRIRENNLRIPEIEAELQSLRNECRNDKDFYKRFMKGFKYVLKADRYHDLNDKIYLHFISYPDSIQ